MIKSNSLPSGVYEVDSACEPCNVRRCGFQGSRVRRIDMRYLSKGQRERVIDVSLKLEVMVA